MNNLQFQNISLFLVKFSVAFIFALLFGTTVFAQTTDTKTSLFKTAVELSKRDYETTPQGAPVKFRLENNDTTALKILANFLGISDNLRDEPLMVEICTRLEENPFISCNNEETIIEIPERLSSPFSIKKLVGGAPESTMENAGSAVGGSASILTNAVDGFSKWLVKRTKQELSMVFFSDFKKKVNEEDYLRTLFPTTVSLLDVIDSDVYQIDAFLNSLQDAFLTDFQTLPYQLPKWAETTKLITDENERFLIVEGMRITPTILEGTNLPNLLDKMCAVRNVPEDYNDVFASIRFMDLISSSLETGADSWEPISYWQENIKKDFVFYTYMGLLWQKGKDMNFGNQKIRTRFDQLGQTLASEKFGTRKDSIKNTIETFITDAKQTSRLIKDFVAQQEERDTLPANVPAFYVYSDRVIGFIKNSDQLRIDLLGGEPSKTFSAVTDVLEKSNNMIFNFREGKFLLGASNFKGILRDAYSLTRTDKKDKNTPKNFEEFDKKYFKYVTFMATVADARNSEDVEYAFDMFAMPAGSSRQKKNSKLSVGLNAYVGPAFGMERLNISGDTLFFALTAPVGININKGFKNRGSWSLHFPILDLGAITAFRFGNDTEQLPELSFKNIIAPGAYVVYGFGKNLPFSLGAGGQMGPNLRKISKAGEPDVTDRGFRLGMFLAVDIPVFNFYSR